MSDKLIPTMILALIAALIFWAMWQGWKNRKQRQIHTGTLLDVPERYDDAESLLAVPGTYVATTVMGDWLDRIATNTLGVKSTGVFFVYEDAVIIMRNGSQDIWIPASDIIGVRTEAGMNGKFVEKDGLAVLSWSLNGNPVDTGFRTRYAADKKSILDAVAAIAPQATVGHDTLARP
ncbi:hypothetical protein [Rothia nasimurium]|uniref:PH-like domain-containing protein n=1 Tax=Rothia nasimurium TaxID=85336 RepID=UPI001F2EAC97|nr:hypothetical protein [Rothia nasimurium]